MIMKIYNHISLRYRLARLVKLPLLPFCMHLIAPSFSSFLIIVLTLLLEQWASYVANVFVQANVSFFAYFYFDFSPFMNIQWS